MFFRLNEQNGKESSFCVKTPFEDNLLFFDVETPNNRNDRISSMGVIVIKDGKEILRENFLINPECLFDERNMQLTGIYPEMVKDAPAFPEVWEDVSDYFESSLCIGHNVAFDLSVLDKTLTYYGLSDNFGPVNYADTLTILRKSYRLAGYGLKAVCENFGIDLGTHHNSLDDANSCLEVFRKIFVDGYWSDENILTKWFGDVSSRADKNTLAKAFTELKGILLGLAIDDIIDANELAAIRLWMTENQNNKNYEGFRKIFNLLNLVLESETLNFSTYRKLLEHLNEATDHSVSDETIAINILKGILKGIVADNEISSKEIENLRAWMLSYSSFGNSYPFNKIFELVEEVLVDGVVSLEENLMLIDRFNKFINPLATGLSHETTKSVINLSGKTCCITGTCTRGTRSEIEEQLTAMGAIVTKSLTRKTDVLIVGGSGNAQWAYGNYGSKIKKALELQDKGIEIRIVGEFEIFFDQR